LGLSAATVAGIRDDAGVFFDALLTELGPALNAALGDRMSDVPPRWARGPRSSSRERSRGI